MIDPEIVTSMDIARKELSILAERRNKMMMGHAEMMNNSDQQCAECAKMIKSGKHDINGNKDIMPMKVKQMDINAPQSMMTPMNGD